MARTALFHWVRRNMRLAQASRHTGFPADEMPEIFLERRSTRRQFLATTATLAAGAALSRCAPLVRTASITPDEVLIVGAGIAGLVAAYRLEQAGVPVRLMEAQNRVGGRMFSLRNFFPEGQVAELGGELIDSNHEAIRNLAAELKIELDDLDKDDSNLSRDVWFFDGQRRSDREVIAAFVPIAAQIESDLATLSGDDFTYDQPNGAEGLDRMSVAQWLDRAGVSGWIRELLDVAYTTEYGLETAEQSALNFLTMISLEDDSFRIFGASDERYHVHQGNDAIVHAVAGRLRVKPETNTMLESVRRRSDGLIECSFLRGKTPVTASAANVILTIPFTMLRQVDLRVDLPAPKRKAIAELGYGTNAKLMVGFNERVWRRHRSNGSVVTDLPFQLCWEASRLQSGRSGILTNFTGGNHGIEIGQGTDREQAQKFVNGLECVFPGVESARAGAKEVRFHWPSHPFTRGSYASYRVGQWTAFRGAEGEPVGNLHFAGEHCSLESQGFMNGGCETGERAAAEVLAALGLARAAA